MSYTYFDSQCMKKLKEKNHRNISGMLISRQIKSAYTIWFGFQSSIFLKIMYFLWDFGSVVLVLSSFLSAFSTSPLYTSISFSE